VTRVIRNRIDGIAEPLPAGETVLWSGRPEALSFAKRQFRLGWVALWFGALSLWRGWEALQNGATIPDALVRATGLWPLAVAALLLLTGLGVAMARSTTYALTRRRLVMNIGVALPITVNIPLRFVDAAAVRELPGGLAELQVTMSPATKLRLSALWPHVGRLADARVRPTFRDVSSAAIASLLPLLEEALRNSDAEQAAIAAPLPGMSPAVATNGAHASGTLQHEVAA
jgi:hypothetical protein